MVPLSIATEFAEVVGGAGVSLKSPGHLGIARRQGAGVDHHGVPK